MKKMGRPKMTIEEHLGLHLKKKEMFEEPPTYEEAKAILIQVYQKLGPIDARTIIEQFEVERLSDMKPHQFGLFIDKCKNALNHGS